MTEFTYRILAVVPDGPAYDAARGAMAQVTSVPEDATATWRKASDVEDYTVTHRVADMLARASDVRLLPGLATQVGGSFHVLESGRGTAQMTTVQTRAAALVTAGVVLLQPVIGEDGEPTGAYEPSE
jgi:hypothetical protein